MMEPKSSPMGNRRRRGAAPSSPTRRNVEARNDNFHYDDESPSQLDHNDDDSKKDKHVQSHVYNKACPIGQFFLNPCGYLAQSSRKFFVVIGSCCAAIRHREPERRSLNQHNDNGETRRIRIDVTLVLFISFTLTYGFSSFLWWYQKYCMVGDAVPIMIKRFDFSNVDDPGGWLYPTKPFPSYRTLLPMDEDEDDYFPDYGEITYLSIQTEKGEEFARRINPDTEVLFEQYTANERAHAKAEKKNKDMNYDDDQFYYSDGGCRRVSWIYSYKPNCNMFHEFDLSRDFDEDGAGDEEDNNYDSSQVSHGFWRDVWKVKNRNIPAGDEDYMLKILRWTHDYDYDSHNEIHRDALVMEQLSASPRIIDMYGHCEMAVSVEAMHKELEDFVVPYGYIQQEDLDDEKDVNPQNDFNATEKLNIAFAMAESLADLHGFKDGVIVHDDVQLCQWLWDKKGKLKLGDFNRAEVRMWSDEDQKYCEHFNGRGYGNWRSPEEYEPDDLDEQIDVYSLGNNIYALLTGLWVFYEIKDDNVVQQKIIKGERGFIDDRYRTRSYAEGKLVEIMEKCWIRDTKDRISIFEAVDLLREAVEENTRREAKTS